MVDDRVPGTPSPRAVEWECPACGRRVLSERQPECPSDGTLMEQTSEPSLKDRRAAIKARRLAGSSEDRTVSTEAPSIPDSPSTG
jgi:hypothetical protein